MMMKKARNYQCSHFLTATLMLFFGGLLIGCKTEINVESGANQNGKTETSATPGAKPNQVNSTVTTNETVGEKTNSALAPGETDEKVIDHYLAGVDEVLDGKENKESRIIVRGDIDGDGDARDAAVQFILEGFGKENGGNFYSLRLAVFRNENGQLKPVTDTEIGGLMSRSVKLKSIENGKINFDTTGYAKDDGACCPSIKGTTAYVLKNDKLTETK